MHESDSIVDEVREAREAIAKASDYDLEKIARAAKEREVRSGRKVVRLPPKKAIVIRKAS
jgi:hypothetical protein